MPKRSMAAALSPTPWYPALPPQWLSATADVGIKSVPGDITVEKLRRVISLPTLAASPRSPWMEIWPPGRRSNLTAGSPGYVGNIDLGQSGVIGGRTVNATASGEYCTGLIISRQSSNINAVQNRRCLGHFRRHRGCIRQGLGFGRHRRDPAVPMFPAPA